MSTSPRPFWCGLETSRASTIAPAHVPRIGRPLSASELARVFLGEYNLSLVAYHLNMLVDADVFEQVGERQVRGAVQRSYFFPGALRR